MIIDGEECVLADCPICKGAGVVEDHTGKLKCVFCPGDGAKIWVAKVLLRNPESQAITEWRRQFH
jgi:hypothetical protein